MRTRTLVPKLAALISMFLCAPEAAADPADARDAPSEVDVVLPACTPPPFRLEPFLAVLTLELRADGVRRVRAVPKGDAVPADADGALARIALEASPCDEGARELVVTVDDAATSKQVVRRIALTDVAPSARPRAMALAVAELLRASWLELAIPPPAAPSSAPPPPTPPPVPVPPAVREAARARVGTMPERIVYLRPPEPAPAKFMIGASGTVRSFPSSPSTLFGGRLFGSIRLGPLPLRARLDVGAGYGTRQDALGEVEVGLATAGLALLYAGHAGPVEAEIGPRVEGGFGWVSGSPVDALTSSDRGRDFVSTLSALGVVHVRLAEALRLSVDLEAGTTLARLDAQADNRRVTGISGPFLAGALGLAYGR